MPLRHDRSVTATRSYDGVPDAAGRPHVIIVTQLLAAIVCNRRVRNDHARECGDAGTGSSVTAHGAVDQLERSLSLDSSTEISTVVANGTVEHPKLTPESEDATTQAARVAANHATGQG